jgi:hypothetical protein
MTDLFELFLQELAADPKRRVELNLKMDEMAPVLNFRFMRPNTTDFAGGIMLNRPNDRCLIYLIGYMKKHRLLTTDGEVRRKKPEHPLAKFIEESGPPTFTPEQFDILKGYLCPKGMTAFCTPAEKERTALMAQQYGAGEKTLKDEFGVPEGSMPLPTPKYGRGFHGMPTIVITGLVRERCVAVDCKTAFTFDDKQQRHIGKGPPPGCWPSERKTDGFVKMAGDEFYLDIRSLPTMFIASEAFDTDKRFTIKLSGPKFLYVKGKFGHRRTAGCGCGWNPDIDGDFCPEHGNEAFTVDNGPISQGMRSKTLQEELEK